MSNALYSSNQNIPQDMLLGNLVFMSLTDMIVPVSDIRSIFKNNGLSERFVRDISAADAFRRATSSIKGEKRVFKKNKWDNDLVDVKFEIDEVKSDTDGIKRIIGYKRVDNLMEEVDYEPVIQFLFDRNSSQIGYNLIPDMDRDISVSDELRDMGDDIMDKFNIWSTYHNRDTVRNIITKVVNYTHPINLMPTGICKFIPKNSTNLIYGLKNALSELNYFKEDLTNGSDNICEIIPVIDTEEQRHLIQENCEKEVKEELFQFTQELKNVISTKGKLTGKAANSFIEKFVLLKQKADTYQNLVGFYIQAIGTQIKTALELVEDYRD